MLNEVDYFALGDRIKQIRKAKSITQDQLSEACSLSTSYIGHIERGSRTLSVETLFKIATKLDVSVDYLLLDSAEMTETLPINLSVLLRGKEQSKLNRFWTTVKILAENIDKL